MKILTLRLKLVLTCLLGLVLLGGGTAFLFSRAWLDLSRAYGLLSLNRKMELGATGAAQLEKGEWLLEAKIPEPPHWVKAPDGVAEADLAKAAESILAKVRGTHLDGGSLEVELPVSGPARNFAVFRSEGGIMRTVGSRAYRSLWDLGPWAAPFLGFFALAFLVSAGLAIFISSLLARYYSEVAAAMSDVAAGRLQNVAVPDASDSSMEVVSEALRNMIATLDQKERKIAQVSKLAAEDSMTGLPNYRAFSTYLEGVLSKSNPKVAGAAVMAILDLDFFKKVNDTHGHQVGDFVLKTVAEVIRANLRVGTAKAAGSDFCGRYGGEEFVVIFANSPIESWHEDALRIVRAIRETKVTVPADISSTKTAFELPVSASAGIAMWDTARFPSREAWVKEADKALYEAKRRGRARLVAMHPTVQEWV